MFLLRGITVAIICLQIQGKPLERRFLLELFGHSFSNPGDMSSAFGTQNQPGDMTNYLDKFHQELSAGATGSGYVQHQGNGGPAFSSQNAVYGHATDHLPGKCESASTNTCPQDCLQIDTVTGCVVCKPSCHNTGSGNSHGTSHATSQTMTSQPNTVTSPSSNTARCPPFSSTCQRGYVAVVNGCPICTAHQQVSTTTKAATTLSPTCAPLRCVDPCNKGVMLDSTGCPACIC